MARPTARVLALLEILQSGGGTRTAADLAARLEVDERTLRRYVDHLIDLDIPVESLRGRYGGYRLSPGYRMPPLMLTDDEALAVLLGLLAGGGPRAVGTSVAATESAAAKIRRVLPQTLGRRLDALLETVEFTGGARGARGASGASGGSAAAPDRPETDVLLTLAEAARHRRPVEIGYTARDGGRSERVVHAYGIVAHSGRWYVVGDDSASGEVRTFRLDRIVSTRVLLGEFDVPEGFDPADRLLTGLAEAPHRHSVSVLVQGGAEQVRGRLPAGLATVRKVTARKPAAPDDAGGDASAGGDESIGGDESGDGPWVRVRMRAERLEWVPGVLAGLGLPFVIEEPDELRAHVRALAGRLTEAADRPVPPDERPAG
jgi:predicted DNA-binding transcriptional regulator YafY